MEPTYTLTLTLTQLRAVQSATALLARLHLGQLDALPDHLPAFSHEDELELAQRLRNLHPLVTGEQSPDVSRARNPEMERGFLVASVISKTIRHTLFLETGEGPAEFRGVPAPGPQAGQPVPTLTRNP